MGDKTEYIDRLQMVIHQLHNCASTWIRTVPVHETFHGQTIWDGEVEVFSVKHDRAQFCYAWSTAEGKFTAVLGLPPATDPQNAVKVSIVAASKKSKR